MIYKSIGGTSTVRGKNKKRKWWCAWLCKRRESKDADRIEIQNTYYSEVSPGIFAILEHGPKICINTSSCQQKEWAFGFGIETKFPNGGNPTPSQLDNLLPVEGVITHHLVDIDGRIIRNTTAKGKHPLAGIQ